MSHHKSLRIQVPESTKNQFIGAMKASGNLRQSAKLVGIKWSTASDIWQRYKRTGSTRNLHRSGRPEKLGDRGKRAVMQEVLQDRKKPFTEVAKNIPGDISEDIVRRVAAGDGYCHVPYFAPTLLRRFGSRCHAVTILRHTLIPDTP